METLMAHPIGGKLIGVEMIGVRRSLDIAWYLSAVDQVPDLHAPRQWLGRLSLHLSAQY
jgi:hypothetical protein